MDITINNEQKISVRANPKTASGQDTRIDGPLTFTVESGDATVQQDADGLGAYIIAGSTGNTTIRVQGDADLSDGERLIEEVINLTVTDTEAETLNLTAGTPEPK